MVIATWILFVLGCLGAADILLFHSISHGIRQHAPSRMELWSHAARGPTYAALFIAIPSLHLGGGWFVGLLVLLVIDLAISIWDFSLEGRSRAQLGGLPTGEYLLHVFLAMLFGGLVVAVLFEGGGLLREPTELRWEPAPVPVLLHWAMLAMAPGVLASGVLDARAALRLGRDRGERSRSDRSGMRTPD